MIRIVIVKLFVLFYFQIALLSRNYLLFVQNYTVNPKILNKTTKIIILAKSHKLNKILNRS